MRATLPLQNTCHCIRIILIAGSKVLRYTALAAGVFYGLSHQRSITATQKDSAIRQEYEQRQRLIDQAKAEYAKRKNPASANTGSCPGLYLIPNRGRLVAASHVLAGSAEIIDMLTPPRSRPRPHPQYVDGTGTMIGMHPAARTCSIEDWGGAGG
jgi:F-type H+-transporting ATP synthase subunit e